MIRIAPRRAAAVVLAFVAACSAAVPSPQPAQRPATAHVAAPLELERIVRPTTARPALRPSRAARSRLAPPSGPWRSGVASWYGERPATCDGRRVPEGIAVWTAHPDKSVACGTIILVRYGGRTIRAPVWDRGPCRRWSAGRCVVPVPGRVLDLSAAAFGLLAPRSVGVIRVRWRVA